MNFATAIFGPHALFEMQRRRILETEVRGVLANPESILPIRPGRIVVQGPISHGSPPKTYLLRVFVDVDRTPHVVVTAYRTGKLDKYRGKQ